MEAVLEPVSTEVRTPAELVRAAMTGDRDAFAALVEPSPAAGVGGAIPEARAEAPYPIVRIRRGLWTVSCSISASDTPASRSLGRNVVCRYVYPLPR